MSSIRIGVPPFVSSRPLVYGLTRNVNPDVSLVYGEPAVLADKLGRGDLDVALVPSIEYLRGTGSFFLEGPAKVARPGQGGITLATQRPADELRRIAVGEYCRTPIAVLRAVLAERFRVMPDLLVEKNTGGDWRESYDAVLMSGDAALAHQLTGSQDGVECIDVTGLWNEVTAKPLVIALWVYNDERIHSDLIKTLVTSRDLGVQNLSRLADGIAQTTQFESEHLYGYLSQCWSYNMGQEELDGLRALEEYALQYDVLREARLERV